MQMTTQGGRYRNISDGGTLRLRLAEGNHRSAAVNLVSGLWSQYATSK